MAAFLSRGRGLLKGAAVPSVARLASTSAVQSTMKGMPKVLAGVPSTNPHTVVDCKSINGGKQLVVEFADNTRYEMHASWLKDSNPTRAGADYYRTCAEDVWSVRKYRISCAEPQGGGEQLSVEYEHAETGTTRPELSPAAASSSFVVVFVFVVVKARGLPVEVAPLDGALRRKGPAPRGSPRAGHPGDW